MSTAKAVKETAIQRDILDWLRAHGHMAERMSLGGVRHGGIYKKNPLKGFPDIFAVLKGGSGRLIAIEVKTKQGRLTKEQIEWGDKLRSFGVAAIVARSVDDVKTLVDTLLILKSEVPSA
jgi:hypothetical protein